MDNKIDKEVKVNSLSTATMLGIRDGMNFNLENIKQKEKICRRLTEIRVANKLTRQQYADKIGVNIFTYASYEKGRTEPPNAVLVRIADAFGLSLDYICCRTDCTRGLYASENAGGSDKEKELQDLRYQLEAIQSKIEDLRRS